ncbi:class I SAM-dependent methyltransferase [Nocardioides sp.]|uniref:class I SAM-dependent methyltransferase n=1 Tax=Nocardioides sp. TaxID=35761 RepID=UPI002CC997CF|nr:methyltransferase domain-containing protein [Nocardioides sp.]HXH78547.1 methyltransferase domain-containing protein [Nocardioides sp.]
MSATTTSIPLAPISTAAALDDAFAGTPCDLVLADGRRIPLATERWRRSASTIDVALFVERCTGPTMDLGCGPGRLAEALQRRGVDVLGVDISAEAVRQTRARGARALRRDVFDALPWLHTWAHVILADGNIGLGGKPHLLLGRVAALLAPGGSALVELAGSGTVAVQEGARLVVGARESRPFDWATVGVAGIHDVSADAGLVVADVVVVAGRHVATLRHRGWRTRPSV